jgi:site-specific DNA recombinase
MLSDPYYTGFVVYKGDIYPGRHEPIVDQTLFDKVQDVLNARSQRGQRDRVHQHYLKGTLFCDRCHRDGRTARLIYTEVSGRGGKKYAYFVCRGRQDGLCDLPHLRAELVEEAIVDHYATLQLPADFIKEVDSRLEDSLTDTQATTHELHASLTRRLAELDAKESRLIDLATDDAMPRAKIRAKLNDLKLEKARIEAGLTNTGEELAIGANVLRNALHLVGDPEALYHDSTNVVRRHLNQTFYERFYLNDLEVVEDDRTPLFAELEEARQAWTQREARINRSVQAEKNGIISNKAQRPEPTLVTGTNSLTLASVLSVTGSSKNVLVGLTVCGSRT